MPKARVVAVVVRLADDREQVGSGFLVGSRLVVTAEHCTRDARAVSDSSVPNIEVVRATDDRSVGVRSVVRCPALDVAVLALAEPLGPDDLPAPRFARVDRSHSNELADCVAIGFPLFQGGVRDEARRTGEVHGVIRVTDDDETGHLLLRDPVLDTVETPRTVRTDGRGARSPWGGLSGAVVFHRGSALGVIVEHRPQQGASAVRLMSFGYVAASSADGASAVAAALDLDAALDWSPECPYLGLTSFGVADAHRFHGRDRAVRAVLDGIREDAHKVLLLGPSGSGKTSLVHAGVLPALTRGELPGSDRFTTLTMVPADLDTTPVATWIRRRVAAQGQRVVLVIDQFEQLLIADEEHRNMVLGDLSNLAETMPLTTLILVMRDEFYSRLAASAPRLVKSKVDVPAALDRGELDDIIRQEGVHFEPHLPERIVDDAISAAPAPAGGSDAATTVLPLVEFTLTELWRTRVDGQLTHDAYRRLEGVVGCLTGWCEQTYASIPARLRPTLRAVLTGLVEPGGEGFPPVRRRRTLRELHDKAPRALLSVVPRERPDPITAVDDVLNRLATARLVVTHRNIQDDTATVELTHDRLIETWPRLRDWLREDHDFLRWRSRIDDAFNEWEKSGLGSGHRDPDLLLRGATLVEAARWVADRNLSEQLEDFIKQSQRASLRQAARERRRTRALEILVVLSLVATGIAVYNAVGQSRQARRAASAALAAKANEALGTRPDVAHLLALRAVAVDPTPEAVQSLRNALSKPMRVSRALQDVGSVNAVAYSPDGRRLASIGEAGLLLWDAGSGSLLSEPPRSSLGILVSKPDVDDFELTYSPDGRQIATAGLPGIVHLWDAETGLRLRDLDTHAGIVTALAYRPDGRQLVAGAYDSKLHVYDPDTGHELAVSRRRLPGEISSVAYHPGGRQLVATYGPNGLRNDDRNGVVLVDPETLEPLEDLPVDGGVGISELAFRPDGRQLAGAAHDGTVRLWDPETRGPLGRPLAGHTGPVSSLRYRTDGGALASAGVDGSIRLRDPDTGQPVGEPLTAQPGAVESVAYSTDGRQLATAHREGTTYTLRLWNLTPSQPLGTRIPQKAPNLAYRPDGRQMATIGRSPGGLRFWNTDTGDPEPMPTALQNETVSAFAYQPGGTRFITAVGPRIQVWDTATNTPVGGAVTAETEVTALLVRPGTRQLLVADGARVLRFRDADTLELVGPTIRLEVPWYRLAFRPDGDQFGLEVGESGSERKLTRWDPDTGQRIGVDLDINDPWVYLPDGRLASDVRVDEKFALDYEIVTWDSNSGERNGGTLTGRIREGVLDLAVRPDGHQVATSDLGAVRLWDPTSRRSIGVPIPNDGLGGGVLYRPDSRQLATMGADGIRLWAAPETWIDHACARAGHNLSRADWLALVGEADYVRACPTYPPGPGAPDDAAVEAYPVDELG